MKHIRGAYCYRVKGLLVPYITPESIDKNISDYIDRIEYYTELLENSFNDGRKADFISTLEKVQKMLQSVYAKHCESYTIVLIHAAKERSLNYCQLLLQQAIADFLLLSIEMQKAQRLDTSHALKFVNVEKNEEAVRSLSAISRLLSVNDYLKAADIASNMKDTEDTFNKIDVMLKSREYTRAKELADTMEKEHIKYITQQNTGSKETKTVLAVDDRPEILSKVNEALRAHYKVLGAPNGKIAVEIMSQKKIDLFYLDIEMPEMDGFELAKRIRADQKYIKTPIIFLTGLASREHISKAIQLGTNDFIVKPSNSVNLLAKARRYMDE